MLLSAFTHPRKSFVSILLSFMFYNCFAQADLVVEKATFTSSRLNRGEYFNATITVKNTGNVTAPISSASIYLTTSSQNTDLNKFVLNGISVKGLQPKESTIIQFIYPLSLSLSPDTYYPIIEIDSRNEVNESNETNNKYCFGTSSCNSLTITNGYTPDRNLTCPIIFVHGWNSSSKTWDALNQYLVETYGLNNGGRLDYCLNDDSNLNTSVGNSKAISFTTTLNYGDFYCVNFDNNPNGKSFFNTVQSNQSAINKQGAALRDAVKKVLAKTGANEVILVGHSMGGLASREYIQNKSNWQDDGLHHVAKLVTIGTPHGGSDASTSFDGLLKFFTDGDLKSESVRDFRRNSVFLLGGKELDIIGYYNKDIDCNKNESDDIDGLNDLTKKPFPSEIATSCVIGRGVNSTYICGENGKGDFVVCSKMADMNEYPKIYSDRFYIESDNKTFLFDNASHINLHTDEDNFSTIIQALDEPKTYDKAYDIPLNTGWFGTVTYQADNDPFPEPQKSTDYDDYRFQLPSAGTLRVAVFDIPVHKFAVSIVDASYRVLKRIESNGASNIDQSITLAAGTYYFEVEATPESNSHFYLYGFGLVFTPSVGPRAEFTSAIRQGCSPLNVAFTNLSTGATSYQWTFEGGTPSTSTASAPLIKYSTPGTYAVTLKATNSAGSNAYSRSGFISVGKAPLSNFNFSVDTSTAQFVNLSDVGVNADYTWNFGDSTTSKEVSPVHKYARKGNYIVTLYSSNVCGGNGVQKTVQIAKTTPVFELQETLNFELFPNPATNKTTLHLKKNPPPVQMRYEVTDLLGIVHIKQNINNENTEITTGNLPNGIYLVNILDNNQFLGSQKLIINR